MEVIYQKIRKYYLKLENMNRDELIKESQKVFGSADESVPTNSLRIMLYSEFRINSKVAKHGRVHEK